MQREDPIRQAFGLSPARKTLRASDADREATAEALRQAHSEGRLATHELDERLDACFAAKTYGDLDGLVADLPRAREPKQAPRRPSLWSLPRLVPIVLLLIAFTLAWHGFWLVWALVLFTAIRFGHRRRYSRRHDPGHGRFV